MLNNIEFYSQILTFYKFFSWRICFRRSLASDHNNNSNAQKRIDYDKREIFFTLVVRKSGGLNVKADHRQPAKALTRAQVAKIMDSRVFIIMLDLFRSVLM